MWHPRYWSRVAKVPYTSTPNRPRTNRESGYRIALILPLSQSLWTSPARRNMLR